MKKVNWQKTIEKYKGRWCTAGIDLSSVSDLTCCVYLFPHDDDREHIDAIMRTWCPEARLHDDKNKYRDQYQAWERQGWLHTTDGNAVDYDFVRAQIEKDSEIFQIGLIGVDSQFQGVEFAIKLGDKLGHTEKSPIVIGCTNSARKMGPVCQEFERRLLEKKFNHGGNPIFRFMADSVSIRTDADGNTKPDKDKSQGKIDGIVSALYALDRIMRSKPQMMSPLEAMKVLSETFNS